ncbi:MAG: hypothetical protein K6A44_06565 [bacterium]|nr:hypothetical protein [bacterium]
MSKDKEYVCPRSRKTAFTLAETLITLLVIGVVAVLTIPALTQQITECTLGKQRDVFSKKFAEGLRQMRVDEKLAEKYVTTEDFVNEMKKYFKIAQICNKDNLTGCFVPNFTYKGEENYSFKFNGNDTKYESTEAINISFLTKNLKTTDEIKAATNINAPNYTSDVMGIVFSDGVQMLIAVNPDCEGITGSDTTGNLYSCFSYIADVNSTKSPNNIKKDIITNIQMLDTGFEIMATANSSGGACPSADYNGNTGSFCYLTREQEADSSVRNKYGIKAQSSYDDDYWGGAMKYCIDRGYKLPSEKQLNKIAVAMGYAASCSKITTLNGQPYYQSCTGSGIDRSIINNKSFLWSNNGYASSHAYAQYFSTSASDNVGKFRNNNSIGVLCIK